jgi:hypothetical protein
MPGAAHDRTQARRRGPRKGSAGLVGLVRAIGSPLRGTALMPVAALAVHELRYRLAFGAHAARELHAQGHAYLSSLAPWIVLLAGLSVGASLGRIAQGWAAGGDGGTRRRVGVRVWLAAAFGLVAIYAGQELLEGWLASGHPGGLAGIFGGGGWWALPAALLVGGGVALALRGEQAVERLVASAPLRLRARISAPAVVWPGVAPLLALVAPLAQAAAERAPPRAPAVHRT